MIEVNKEQTIFKGNYNEISTEVTLTLVNFLGMSQTIDKSLVKSYMINVCDLMKGYANAMSENKTPDECKDYAVKYMVEGASKDGV